MFFSIVDNDKNKAKYYKKKINYITKELTVFKDVFINLSVEFSGRRHYWDFSYVYHIHEYEYPYFEFYTYQLDSPIQTETLNI